MYFYRTSKIMNLRKRCLVLYEKRFIYNFIIVGKLVKVYERCSIYNTIEIVEASCVFVLD
ncbi:hypothetical protein A0H76_1498 [Hepatospora eriocheir]|uniref:Uncharacterized protein n=1 Tax=Hepatospora eriocheir TaxID=1081669 RepID=A0A1X0QKM0_9MICR|nr:hypothetical protein A0H76_1498 [Hepatospora eriocheir]